MSPQIIVGSTTHIPLTIKIQDLDPTWNHVVERAVLCSLFPICSAPRMTSLELTCIDTDNRFINAENSSYSCLYTVAVQ